MKELIRDFAKRINNGDFSEEELNTSDESIMYFGRALCNNWPIFDDNEIQRLYDDIDPDDILDCKDYSMLSCGNINFTESVDSNGNKYAEVSCGDDGETFCRLKIEFNKGEDKDRYPLTCKDILIALDSENTVEYKEPDNYKIIRESIDDYFNDTYDVVFGNAESKANVSVLSQIKRYKKFKGDSYIDTTNCDSYCKDLPEMCSNWPILSQNDTYETLDLENFDAEFLLDNQGNSYLSVKCCGGDWQKAHSFDIVINHDGEFPLKCSNIKYECDDKLVEFEQLGDYNALRESLKIPKMFSEEDRQEMLKRNEEYWSKKLGGNNTVIIDKRSTPITKEVSLQEAIDSNGNIFEKPRGRHKWIK